ncbi:phosphatase [Acrocarpospora phusangensis]|uniref:Phosphatase n=1 Tax=Acrocarpospora phusangensis TaxID=1070424 RepID=A0A919QDU7_9ACTN|nr:histidine phosphatase family protein [Acrocarpospora phusangensis]GIH24447.1 phosphatase [Acrocarpospora phusangensis]
MELILLRHGETEWSRAGRHTGRTDLPLTEHGEAQAKLLAPLVEGRRFDLVLVSPARRARHTAELAGFASYEVEPDLWEWDYGGYEGITTAEVRQSRPGWYLWRDGVVPGDEAHPGEDIEHVGLRADRVVARVLAAMRTGHGEPGPAIAVVAHGHLLRVLAARWLGLPPADGRLLRLDTGTYSTLGLEHDQHVILRWNAPAGG